MQEEAACAKVVMPLQTVVLGDGRPSRQKKSVEAPTTPDSLWRPSGESWDAWSTTADKTWGAWDEWWKGWGDAAASSGDKWNERKGWGDATA